MAGRGARPLPLLAAAALLLGTLPLLSRAWWPLESLVGLTADDMFYYLEIARNLAEGRGPTFDGHTPTNGWHPLWMGILVGLRWLVADDALQVHLALSLLAGAFAGTGLLLWRVARRAGGPAAGLGAVAAWSLQPWTGLITLSGVEAPLATLALAGVLALLDGAGTPRGAARLGLAMGLACLARTDSVLVCGVVGLVAYTPALARTPRVGLGLAARCLGAGTVLVGPWLGWNLLRFGRISQDSARAIASLRHRDWFAAHTPGEFLASLPHRLVDYLGFSGDTLGLPWAGALALPLLALAAAALLARRDASRARLLAVVGGGVLAVAAFYAWVLWYHQRWYLLSSLMLLSLGAGLAAGAALDALARRLPRLPPAAPAAAAVGLVAALSLPHQARLAAEGTWPWQRVYLQVGQRLDKLPPGSKVGAFNAGIYGYFAGLPVVNLDGVVNGPVLDAMARRGLLAWLREEGVTHVVDHEQAFGRYMERAEPAWATAFELHARFPNSSSGGDVLLTSLKAAH